jgi:type III HopA1-like effector protein
MALSRAGPSALPAAVAEALGRLGRLVTRGRGTWLVDGSPAGSGPDTLADALYTQWYTQPGVPAAVAPDDPPLRRRFLLAALRAAQARPPTTEGGWTVIASDPLGSVSAARAGQARWLRPGEYVMPLRPGAPPAPGEPIDAIASLDHFDAERNLWWALASPGPEPPTGRIYLDARPATAPRVVHEVTAALEGLAFQLKCPVFADACERVDAVVVYHARTVRAQVLDALLGQWITMGPLLDPAVPPLTCVVRPGLAWADDVHEAESYGQSRCRLLAEAIDHASVTWHAMAESERVAALVAGLREAGVDPREPWRAPG